MEVFAEAAGVVVEDGLGISETFQNGKHFYGLERPKRMMAEVGACQHFASIKKTPCSSPSTANTCRRWSFLPSYKKLR